MIHLRYHGKTTVPLEVAGVAPDRLASLPGSAIAALPVLHGNATAPLGDFFTVTGNPADQHLVVEGDCGHVKWLGAGMTSGTIAVRGRIGTHLGSQMKGGMIEVHGDTDDWAGAEMRGGRIHIHGSVGTRAGAAYPGSRKGMRGGALLIDGDAGDELGAVQRRGLIAVAGRVGEFAGASMVAGSLFVFGTVGRCPAAGMRRGTLALFGGEPELLPTFRCDGTYRPTFIELYLRQLRAWGFSLPAAAGCGEFQRYGGDIVSLGKGEVLVWRGQ